MSQFKDFVNKGLKDRSKSATEFSIQLIKYAAKRHDGIAPEDKMAALILLLLNTDKIKNRLSFIGE